MAEPLQGSIDRATRYGISGWVHRPGDPDSGVVLRITVDGHPVARVRADRYREDLERAGIGDGRHAFEFRFPSHLSADRRHSISIRAEPDGEHAPGSPIWLDHAGAFDDRLKRRVASAVDAVASAEERRSVAAFLAWQARRLDREADRSGEAGAPGPSSSTSSHPIPPATPGQWPSWRTCAPSAAWAGPSG